MRIHSIVLMLALLATASCTAPHSRVLTQAEKGRRVTLLLGQSQFDELDWDPIEDHFMVGAEYSSVVPHSLAGFEVGVNGSWGSATQGGIDYEGTVLEGYAGIRLQAQGQRVRPYFGGGLSISHVEIEESAGGSSTKDDDAGFGYYLRAGLGVRVTDRMDVVFDVRRRFEASSNAESVRIDSEFTALSVGISF